MKKNKNEAFSSEERADFTNAKNNGRKADRQKIKAKPAKADKAQKAAKRNAEAKPAKEAKASVKKEIKEKTVKGENGK